MRHRRRRISSTMQAIGDFVDAVYNSNYRSIGAFRDRMRSIVEDGIFWEKIRRRVELDSERDKLERSMRARLRSK